MIDISDIPNRAIVKQSRRHERYGTCCTCKVAFDWALPKLDQSSRLEFDWFNARFVWPIQMEVHQIDITIGYDIYCIYIFIYIYIVNVFIYIYTRLYKKINRSIQIREYYRNKTLFDIWSSRSTSPGGACACTPWLCAAQRARWTERGGFCGLLEWSRRDTGHGMAPHGSTHLWVMGFHGWWLLVEKDCWKTIVLMWT